MYQVGEQVLYGIHGVCRIVGIEERPVDQKRVSYYVLEPIDQMNSRFYVPSENPVAVSKLQPILTREKLEVLLQSAARQEQPWIPDENQRKLSYKSLLTSGDRDALIGMICTLHRHKRRQEALGRKFHLCDETFLRDAERMLGSEFSLVLNIPLAEVSSYVRTRLEEGQDLSRIP